MKSVFIFRRDFRLFDNKGFIECYKKSEKILPIFIFTPEQIENNEYFSSNAFQFMIESLEDLNKELKDKYSSQLHYYYGNNIDVLKELLKTYDYDAIYFNMDYTPYAIKRDESIKKLCNDNKKDIFIYEDYLLMNIDTYLKEDSTPYLVYGPFKKKARTIKVDIPNNFKFDKNKFENLTKIRKNKYSCKITDLDKYYEKNPDILINGGRDNAINILKNMKTFVNYSSERNNLILQTTHLSPYIKFGCVSIREVYNTIFNLYGIAHGLIDQLYWREFYFYIAYYIPKVLHGHSLKEKYDGIKWDNNYKIFEAWKKGETGFPAVDAGMREMNKTGYMHNRARLITSGILIKILNCDWRMGEKYFATKLIDYDPIVNNGNWQWSSGSGADSQPYFRIMSPWKQSIDNDNDCLYIKKWVPELKDVDNKDIHNWGKNWNKYKNKVKYPKPIVDYEIMRKEIVEIYKKGLYEK